MCEDAPESAGQEEGIALLRSSVERKTASSVSSVLAPPSEESESSESDVALNSSPPATMPCAFFRGAFDSGFAYLAFFGFEAPREEIFALAALWISFIIILTYCWVGSRYGHSAHR